jgi:hypothetical protein
MVNGCGVFRLKANDFRRKPILLRSSEQPFSTSVLFRLVIAFRYHQLQTSNSDLLSGSSVAELWRFNWTSGEFPRPCRSVPDGPIAGNGDLGLIIGGNRGSLEPPTQSQPAFDPSEIDCIMYFEKNDFWVVLGLSHITLVFSIFHCASSCSP